jgi:hypothetical protein
MQIAENLFKGLKKKEDIIATIQDLQLSRNIIVGLTENVFRIVSFSHSNWMNLQTSERHPSY